MKHGPDDRIVLDDYLYAPVTFYRIRPERGRRRDRCDVRIPYYPKGRHIVSGPDYAWCGEIARWKRGDQVLCDFHAGVLYAIRNVDGANEKTFESIGIYGITVDGKWK